MKCFAQVEYQTADGAHLILLCIHFRRFFVMLVEMVLDDKTKFNDVKLLSILGSYYVML